MKAVVIAALIASLATSLVWWLLLVPAEKVPPRIDGTSRDRFETSVDRIKGAMSEPGSREHFEEALKRIAESLANSASAADPAAASRRLRDRLHGKTADEVLSMREEKSEQEKNEAAAIATLKNISSAQSQCQASGVIDVNGNGAGEYGFFGELSGRVAVRASKQTISPPVLSTAFGNVANARVTRNGYVFQMFLPGETAQGIAEDPTGGDPDNGQGVGAGQAEILWCCYAWPQTFGESGTRTFFVNQSGDVLATTVGANRAHPRYGETTSVRPDVFAATRLGEPRVMDSPIAVDTLGLDGSLWVIAK